MYPEALLDHFQNPRNVGELPPPAVVIEASNPACGDILRLSARIERNAAAGTRFVIAEARFVIAEARFVIAEARFKVRGCTASIAAASALTEWLTGKSRAEVAAFEAAIVESALGGLRAESKHAAVLCKDAVKLLLAAWKAG